MTETLEQTVQRIAEEVLGQKLNIPQLTKQVAISRRIVAELAKQEPVAWCSIDKEGKALLRWGQSSDADEWIPLYAAPTPMPEVEKDAALWYQIESKFGPEKAIQYPEIVKADAAIQGSKKP